MLTEDHGRKLLRERTYLASELLAGLLSRPDPATDLKATDQRVEEALREIRFDDGKERLFAIDTMGRELLHSGENPLGDGAQAPALEETPEVFQGLVRSAKKSGEGYLYYKIAPTFSGRGGKKVAFVKWIEPLGFFLGSAVSIEGMEESIRQEVISTVEKIAVENEGYVFVASCDGKLLSADHGEDLFSLSDIEGVPLAKVLPRQASAHEAVFYNTSPNGDSPAGMGLLYVDEFAQWDWIVGARATLDDVEHMVQSSLDEKVNRLTSALLMIVTALSVFFLLVIVFEKRRAELVRDIFGQFNAFFEKAAGQEVELDEQSIELPEFRALAKTANRMISARSRVEGELRDSEERYRELVEQQRGYLLRLTPEGVCAFANSSLCRFLELSEDEVAGRAVSELLGAQALKLSKSFVDGTLKEGGAEIVELEVRLPNGTGRWIAWRTSGVFAPDGDLKEILAIGDDITQRIQAEAKLRQTEEFLASAFDQTSAGILIVEVPGTWVRMANKAALSILGVEELGEQGLLLKEGRNYWEVLKTDGTRFPAHELPLVRALEKGETVVGENLIIRRRDGQERWVTNNAAPIRDDTGAVVAVVSVLVDITSDKLSERRLYASMSEHNSIVRSIKDVVFRIDRAGKFLYVSDAVKRFGYTPEELIGRSYFEMVHKDDREKILQVMQDYIEKGVEGSPVVYRMLAKDGEIRDVESLATIEGAASMQLDGRTGTFIADDTKGGPKIEFVGVLRDVTKRLELEKRVDRNQKLEAIGSLAGGIAHDFNNLLSAIAGYVDLALGNLDNRERATRNLENVLAASKRASELVSQILTFSRQVKGDPKPVHLSMIIKESLRLLRASLPSTIKIVEELSSEAMVFADPSQLHQLVMNLCTNAGYAMRTEGGRLTVTLQSAPQPKMRGEKLSKFDSDECLHMVVADTGPGIAPDLVTKIFEPFFTTKNATEGTGLGLSVVSEVVEQLGGIIRVKSELGRGTVFDIYLPIADLPEQVQDQVEPQMVMGNERVLVVDDEQLQVDFMLEALGRLGYEVTAVTDSMEALEIFRASPYSFDAVVTDMTMPNMTGDVLARRMLLIRPELPIVVCTGYSERINAKVAKAIGVKRLAFKPITGKVLAKHIRDAIGQAGADG
jgi:PAS domain S-box-containing protein